MVAAPALDRHFYRLDLIEKAGITDFLRFLITRVGWLMIDFIHFRMVTFWNTLQKRSHFIQIFYRL